MNQFRFNLHGPQRTARESSHIKIRRAQDFVLYDVYAFMDLTKEPFFDFEDEQMGETFIPGFLNAPWRTQRHYGGSSGVSRINEMPSRIAKLELEGGKIVERGRFRDHDLNTIQRILEANRPKIQAKWDELERRKH